LFKLFVSSFRKKKKIYEQTVEAPTTNGLKEKDLNSFHDKGHDNPAFTK